MIKDKNPQVPAVSPAPPVTEPEEVAENAIVNVYQAVKRAIQGLREDPENPDSPALFKTIAIDNGQFARIVRSQNMEYEVAFPAIFIHFVNIRYLVQQQRIGEGRATMRVRFILNTLNNSDPERECDPFVIFQRLNVAIQDAKEYEPALNERCNLTYFDMPQTTNMLQAYWLDYEIWFRESSAFRYRNWVKRYLVMPPFTDHPDAPDHDTENHGRHPVPGYDEASAFDWPVDAEVPDSGNTPSEDTPDE